jgi:hypothetical protein
VHRSITSQPISFLCVGLLRSRQRVRDTKQKEDRTAKDECETRRAHTNLLRVKCESNQDISKARECE